MFNVLAIDKPRSWIRNMKISVYIITNTVNAKQYVGITKNLSKRWKRHCGASSDSPALKNAIAKYGVDKFVITHIADAFDFESACAIEKMLIIQHNTRSPNGYNLTDGGEGKLGSFHTEETKIKIGLAGKGRKHTEEAKLKMSLVQKGKKLTEEHKRKIALAHTGKKMTLEQKALLPKRVLSESHKAKIRASMIAHKAIEKAKNLTTVLDT